MAYKLQTPPSQQCSLNLGTKARAAMQGRWPATTFAKCFLRPMPQAQQQLTPKMLPLVRRPLLLLTKGYS